MKLNVRFHEQNELSGEINENNETIGVDFLNDQDEHEISATLHERCDSIGVDFGNIQIRSDNNYNRLTNRPSINSVILEGSLTAYDLGLGSIYYDTSANWNSQRSLISQKAAVYIYSDYDYIEDQAGNQIPIAGIKIGDGNAYLIDLPFVSDLLTKLIIEHVANGAVHVTEAEKEFWNNKVSSYMDRDNQERLILSKIKYEMNGIIIDR